MPYWAVAAVVVSAAAVVAALAVAVFAVLGLLRRVKTAGPRLEPYLARLADSTEQLAVRAEHAATSAPRVEEALGQLGSSLARLRVLGWALRDVRALVSLVRAAVPRK